MTYTLQLTPGAKAWYWSPTTLQNLSGCQRSNWRTGSLTASKSSTLGDDQLDAASLVVDHVARCYRRLMRAACARWPCEANPSAHDHNRRGFEEGLQRQLLGVAKAGDVGAALGV